jgi:hypothetical protein
MNMSVRRKSKSGRARFLLISFLAMFFIAMIPGRVMAQQCCPAEVAAVQTIATNTTKDTFTNWLQSLGLSTQILGVLTSVYNFFTGILQPLMGQGFSAVSAAVTGSGMVQSNVFMNGMNFTQQGNKYNLQTQSTGQDQANSTMSNKSSACAVTQLGQAMERLGQRDYLGAAAAPALSGICKGTSANCTGPGYAGEEVNDLCQLGFIASGQYGSLQQNCPASQNPNYAGSPNLEDFLDNPMMPLATPCVLPDGYLSFSGPPAGSNAQCQNSGWQTPTYNQDPSQSQLAWVNAFKVCEMMNDISEPTVFGVNRNATGSDIARIRDDMALTTIRTSDRNECLHALWDRTACPANLPAGAAQAIGMSETCHQDQVAVCQALMTDPNPTNADVPGVNGSPSYPSQTGLGITDDPYLQNCQQNGLSIQMAKKIAAYRCNSAAFMSNVLPNIMPSAHETEKFAQSDCERMKEAYQKELDDEDNRISTLMRDAWVMHSQHIAPDETGVRQ